MVLGYIYDWWYANEDVTPSPARNAPVNIENLTVVLTNDDLAQAICKLKPATTREIETKFPSRPLIQEMHTYFKEKDIVY